MKKAAGFITLHRQILDWEWYRHPHTAFLFIHLLLSANYVDGVFKGMPIKRGQLVTSLTKLSTDTGLSIQQARTALNHLCLTGEVTDDANNQYRVITVVKYDDYQKLTDKSTGNQQATNTRSNRQLTGKSQTDQQQYNNNNINNVNKETIEQYTGDSWFDEFWNSYPKKVGKQDAVKAWKKIKPDAPLMGKIISGLNAWKDSEQWNKADGQYIPYPATWLNKRKWEDEVPKKKQDRVSQRVLPAADFEQRDYSDVPDDDMARLAAEMAQAKKEGIW
jgi:hypothetical protein